MSKGYTYTVTEADGFKHTRYSARHTAPIYTHAVVRKPHGDKAEVAFSSRQDLAAAQLHGLRSRTWGEWSSYAKENGLIGKPVYPDAKLYPVEATPGRSGR